MTDLSDQPVTESTDEVAQRSWRGLRTVVLERHDRRRDVCDALGMSFIRIKALRRIADGPCTMRALAEALAVDAPYTTLMVDDLERLGLVARTQHPDDRRAKLVTITAAGRKSARVADRILNEPPAVLRGLSDADIETLDRIVARLLQD